MNEDQNNVVDLADLEGDFQTAKSSWDPEDKPFDDSPIPDGRYQVVVERAELTTSKAGNGMLKWTLAVVSGKYAKRKLWRHNMLSSSTNFRWLLSDLHICKVHLDKLSDLHEKVHDLLDCLLEVTVKNATGADGKTDQRVYHNKFIKKQEPSQARSEEHTSELQSH